MAEIPDAPPRTAASDGSLIFVMFGVILAQTGIFATSVTQRVTSSVRSGCSPISDPILRSVMPCGHEKLSSKPSTPVSWTMRVNSCQRLFSYSSMIDAIRMLFGYSFLTCRNSSSQTSIGRSEISSMFSKPITSPVDLERSFPYRGTTFTTFADSRLTVFATAPPQPASNDFASTRAFVPGGPEPSTNGLGNFMPLTVMDRSINSTPLNRLLERRKYPVVDRGRTARCCARRGSYRDRDRRRGVHPYRGALRR